MAGDVRTNVILSAETKGFDKALRQTLGINEAALKGLKGQAESYKTVQKEISGYQGKLDDLSKTQLKLSRSMEATGDKGTKAYADLKDSLREVNREARGVERVITNLEKAYRKEGDAVKTLGSAQKRVSEQQQQDARQARGAFMQGAIQAGVPGMAPLFMQRGPGMRRQAMGMMAGGALRRGAGAAGGLMFGGIGGLQQAISAIPGGGIIAGQLGAAAGFAGRALQFQRQRVEAAPYFEGADPEAVRRAQARITALGPMPTKAELARRGVETVSPLERAAFGKPRTKAEAVRQGAMTVAGWIKGQTREEALEEEAGKVGIDPALAVSPATRIQREWRRKRARREGALERARAGPIAEIGAMGLKYRGLGRQEAEQEAAAIMQAAGGEYGGGEARFMRTAMAARTRFGLGPEVTGAFGAGARRGGLVGARGRGGEAMTESLADAMRLGLKGSEITTYMQQVAQGIQSFEQTGIPFNKESISSMATEISKAGIAGTRAARIAGGVQQYVSGIGQRGIRGGLDIMALQAFGGYTGKGGAEELKRAMIQAEEMGGKLREGGVSAAGPEMLGYLKKLLTMRGGGAAGEFFMRGKLREMGVGMSTREMGLLATKARGGKLTAEQTEYVDIEAEKRRTGKIAAGEIGTPEGLMAEAAKLIPASLRKQAEIANTQLAVGKRMLPTIQNLEKSSININKIFATLAGEPLTKMTTAIEEFTVELGKAKGLVDVTRAALALVGLG